jgi:hypothetical protein
VKGESPFDTLIPYMCIGSIGSSGRSVASEFDRLVVRIQLATGKQLSLTIYLSRKNNHFGVL